MTHPTDSGRRYRQPDPVQLNLIAAAAAWLHLWTPPRGAQVPAVPWLRLGVGATGVAALVAGILALALPRIDRSKHAAAERRQSATAAFTASERAHMAAEQRPQSGRAPGGPATSAVQQRATVAALEADLAADAANRVRRRELNGPVLGASCEPWAPGAARPSALAPTATGGRFECLALTSELGASKINVATSEGYPFWARIDFRRGTYVWCKINPRPGERSISLAVPVVPLAPACDLTK